MSDTFPAGISAAGVAEAVLGAVAAQREWATWAPSRRGEALAAWADALPPAGFGACYDLAHDWAGRCDKLFGQQHPGVPGELSYTQRDPLGVIGVILSWRDAEISYIARVFAALATGNAAVVKPSGHDDGSAIALTALAHRAGLPAGLVTVVTGDAATGAELAAHPMIAGLQFTGTVQTGRQVAALAALTLKPITLDLGLTTTHILLSDADLDTVAQTLLTTLHPNTSEPSGTHTSTVQSPAARTGVSGGPGSAVVGSVSSGGNGMTREGAGPGASGAEGESRRQVNGLWRAAGRRVLAERSVAAELAGRLGAAVTGGHADGNGAGPGGAESGLSEDAHGASGFEVVGFAGDAELLELTRDGGFGQSVAIWTRDMTRMLGLAGAVNAVSVSCNTAQLAGQVSPDEEVIAGLTRTRRVCVRYQMMV
jgi:hypothetical protein